MPDLSWQSSPYLTSGSNLPSSDPLHSTPIDRKALVTRYNPTRTHTSPSTPLQVGNGGFAFGTDITGLQTFTRYAIMSDWGWKSDALPEGKKIDDFKGLDLPTNGRPVNYDLPDPVNPAISQWLISNPNRMNLGAVGLHVPSCPNIVEEDLSDAHQTLDMWTGTIRSSFKVSGALVRVTVACASGEDTVGIRIESDLIAMGGLQIFFDFPYNDGSQKFSAPLVGIWDRPSTHMTSLDIEEDCAIITHILDDTTYYTAISSSSPFDLARESPQSHRYILSPRSHVIDIAVSYSADKKSPILLASESIVKDSEAWWYEYWMNGGFADVVTCSSDPRANELQRRIVSSQYLMAVNAAGNTPPQESGLVNNTWYGKFHMEMVTWHATHWLLWNRFELADRYLANTYQRFLEGSMERAQKQQGYIKGARWPKMTDPSGRSAPGEINNLLIWQQVHPIWFAELYARSFGWEVTSETWEPLIEATADFMVVYAVKSEKDGKYHLGPPLRDVSERTEADVTVDPSFELSFWYWGLSKAIEWKARLEKPVPLDWREVKDDLADLPTLNGLYSISRSVGNFWEKKAYTFDHPTLVGLYGWLPPTEKLDVDVAATTAQKVRDVWDLSDSYGWDFPMLAMSSARLQRDKRQPVADLMNSIWTFDDNGYPGGSPGVVPSPYFPGSGSLLQAVAMMLAGWDRDDGLGQAPGFPTFEEGWGVRWENINKAL